LSSSMPVPERPQSSAEASTEPEPMNGSSTLGPGPGECLNLRHQDRQRLLGRVQLVPGTNAPVDYIPDHVRRLRPPPHEQVSRFMLVAQQPHR
jgi:hypothetical protein